MKRLTPCLHLALVSLLLTANAPAAERPTSDLPFKLSQGYLIVAQGSIGPLDKLNFLIDTGAIPTTVDRRIAKKAGLVAEVARGIAFGQKTETRQVVLPDLQLGPIWVQALPVAVGDLSFLAGARIDAIIGLDVLTRSSFSIDYESRVLSFGPVQPSISSTALQVVWPFLTVQLKVGDQPVCLLVDTGSHDLILFERRIECRLPKMLPRAEKTIYHAAGQSHLRKVRLSRVSLGQTQWDVLPAFLLDASTEGYPEVDGVLGVLTLGAKRLHFDFQRNRLSWEQ